MARQEGHEESVALAALVYVIVERTGRNEFPAVRPQELVTPAEIEDAELLFM